MCKACNQHLLVSTLLVVSDFVPACIYIHVWIFLYFTVTRSYMSPYCSYAVPLYQPVVTGN